MLRAYGKIAALTVVPVAAAIGVVTVSSQPSKPDYSLGYHTSECIENARKRMGLLPGSIWKKNLGGSFTKRVYFEEMVKKEKNKKNKSTQKPESTQKPGYSLTEDGLFMKKMLLNVLESEPEDDAVSKYMLKEISCYMQRRLFSMEILEVYILSYLSRLPPKRAESFLYRFCLINPRFITKDDNFSYRHEYSEYGSTTQTRIFNCECAATEFV